MKAELEQKKDVLISMEAELAKVSHWNSQVDGSSYRCDMMVAKYTELVNLLTDRWRRIDGQIDTRCVLCFIQRSQSCNNRHGAGFRGWFSNSVSCLSLPYRCIFTDTPFSDCVTSLCLCLQHPLINSIY